MLGLGNSLVTGVVQGLIPNLYSIDFDGANDHINCSDITVADTFTISGWAKPTDASDFQVIMAKYDDSVKAEKVFRIILSGSKALFILKKTDGNDLATSTTTTDFQDGVWTHFAFTNDGSSLKGYINGSLEDTDSTTGGDINTDDGDFLIGAQLNSGAVANFFEGNIDEVAIFSSALTGAQISQLAQSQPQILGMTGLQSYWRMGDGSFDDETNGVVHDQTDPGLEADYLTTSWSGETGGWGTTTGGIVNSGTNGTIRQNLEFTDFIGSTYKAEYTLSSVTNSGTPATDLRIRFGGGNIPNVPSTEGTHVYYLVNDATVDNFQFSSINSWAGTITNISLKKLKGNPGLTSGGPTFSSDTP